MGPVVIIDTKVIYEFARTQIPETCNPICSLHLGHVAMTLTIYKNGYWTINIGRNTPLRKGTLKDPEGTLRDLLLQYPGCVEDPASLIGATSSKGRNVNNYG